MKKFIILWAIICLLLASFSCTTVVPVQLNTMRPARVSYPTAYPPVTVICNATVPEVGDYSRYINEEGKRFRMNFANDNIPHFFTMSMASRLMESACFDTVQVHFPDSSALTGLAGVTPTQAAHWQAADPDRVTFSINEIRPCATMRVELLDGYVGVSLRIASEATIQCIIPGSLPVTEIVNDTLMWYAYGDSPQMAKQELPPFDLCLEEALSSLSLYATQQFVPHIRSVERYIFVTDHAAMQDAYRYWQNEQYTEASYIWEYVYEKATNDGRRARAAANLALYHELNDDYATAMQYAHAAQTLFTTANEVAEAAYAASYHTDLGNRHTDTILLDTQWGR